MLVSLASTRVSLFCFSFRRVCAYAKMFVLIMILVVGKQSRTMFLQPLPLAKTTVSFAPISNSNNLN